MLFIMVAYSWVVRFNWNGAACWPSLSYVLEDASGGSSYEWWCRDYAPGADPGSLQGRREAVRKFWCPCEPFSQVSSVVVEAVTQLSPTVKGFSMRVENENLSFKAGQWVDMHIPSVNTVGGYSITSAPHLLREKRQFTLAIQHSSHPPTLWMTSQCQVGDTLSVRVGGDFVYDPTPSESRDSRLQSCDLCLIAGGMGINPLMSILLHHTRLVKLGQIRGRVKLLYSARTVADLLFKEEIEKLYSKNSSWLSYQYFITRQKPVTCAADSHTNIVQRRLEEADISVSLESLGPAGQVWSYVCGPQGMIESVTQWLVTCGTPHRHIHTEKWW